MNKHGTRLRYYEIIDTKYTGAVTGVCCDPNDADEEGHVFGEITKAQYDRYGDHWWTKPKSKRRYILEAKPKLLKRVKAL